jgi:ABC-2 type transport system permease protein
VTNDADTARHQAGARQTLSIPPEYGEGAISPWPCSDTDGTDQLGDRRNGAPTLVTEGGRAGGGAASRRAAIGAIGRASRVVQPAARALLMVPGVALLLMVITTVLGSMAIARRTALEQLNVSRSLGVGKTPSFGLIGVDVFLVVGVAVLWFQIPLRGSFPLLLGLSLVYLLCTLGLGLFVSTVSKTQQQAMMTAVFFFMLPMIYLSGFIFPIENMPAVIAPITYLIPLRYYLVIVRGIFRRAWAWSRSGKTPC